MPLPQIPPTPGRQGRPFARMRGALGAAAMIALLVGCTPWSDEVQFFRPSTPDAKTCREQCEMFRTQCQQRQEVREKECAQGYAIAKAEYDLCIADGTRKCLEPYTCLGPDMSICQREYMPCSRACSKVGERRPGTAPPPKVEQAGGAAG